MASLPKSARARNSNTALAASAGQVEEAERPVRGLFSVGPATDLFSVFRIPIPARPPEHALYRLRVAAKVIWLDGWRLEPGKPHRCWRADRAVGAEDGRTRRPDVAGDAGELFDFR